MSENKNIMEYETVELDDKDDALVIIDQTKLPGKTEIIRLKTAQEMWDAIYLLKVRGAPAIGVAAAFGIYLLAKQIDTADYSTFLAEFRKQKEYLDSSRPTAVNLSWALKRMEKIVTDNGDQSVEEIKRLLKAEADAIKVEDIRVCKTIGEFGLTLVKPGDGILTHCNAGTLATAKYGTALAPVYAALDKGLSGLRVYCDETRPLLQGARLSAFEMVSAGVDTTLLCDNMASSLMKSGKVDIIFVGCDRVARNGDAANKIGTSGVAILAAHYGIPFYVCAPSSTIDGAIASGEDIPIEFRDGAEVTELWYEKRMAPEGVGVYNPAFDVTDASLITGIITERGIVRAPYEEGFRALGLV